MLVLLPPSEGKSIPRAGPPLDLAALSLPSLTPARRAVLPVLADLCRSDPEHARVALGLSPRQAGDVARNADLLAAATAPAAEVYSGVLYQALGYAGLGRAARRRLDRWVLVWSGLWGAVRLPDPIPAYRLSGAVALPGTGPLAAFWRPHLRQALAPLAGEHVILDLRSGTYASSWTGPPSTTLVGRVVLERGGQRTVASHLNKATKGRLLRALAEQGGAPRSTEELVEVIRGAGFRAEVSPPGRTPRGRPPVLDIVVESL